MCHAARRGQGLIDMIATAGLWMEGLKLVSSCLQLLVFRSQDINPTLNP